MSIDGEDDISVTQAVAGSRRDQRRKAILDAAEMLFLERGFGATSLGDIVRRSGGSLATLYDLFGNKSGLFHAILERGCAELADRFEAATPSNATPAVALRRIADQLFDLLIEDHGVAFVRMIISEAKQFPDLGRTFLALGPEAYCHRLGVYLEQQTRRGALAVDQPQIAAMQFCQLVIGHHQVQRLCGGPPIDSAERKKYLDTAIDTFLERYRADR